MYWMSSRTCAVGSGRWVVWAAITMRHLLLNVHRFRVFLFRASGQTELAAYSGGGFSVSNHCFDKLNYCAQVRGEDERDFANFDSCEPDANLNCFSGPSSTRSNSNLIKLVVIPRCRFISRAWRLGPSNVAVVRHDSIRSRPCANSTSRSP